MSKRLMIAGALLLLSVGAAPAQTPSPDAMAAARNLVGTLKLADQYKAMLPGIILSIKPAVTQDRPETERDFDAIVPSMTAAYTPHFNAMVDAAAAVYANAFTVEELREIDAFYRRPAGQKLLQNAKAINEQTAQVGQDGGRRAAEALRAALPETLRQRAK